MQLMLLRQQTQEQRAQWTQEQETQKLEELRTQKLENQEQQELELMNEPICFSTTQNLHNSAVVLCQS